MLGTPRIHRYSFPINIGCSDNARGADNQQETLRTLSRDKVQQGLLRDYTRCPAQAGDEIGRAARRRAESGGTRNDLTFLEFLIQECNKALVAQPIQSWQQGPRFTLQDGTVISLADWIDDRVFGTIQLSNAQSVSLECFGAGLSQQIPGGTRTLTSADTNLQRPGSNGLPQAYEMLVFSIGIDLIRACRPPTGQTQPTLADTGGALSESARHATFFGINRVTNIQFKYREKVYAEGIIVNFPNGRGEWINVTTSDFEVVNNGRPDPRSRNSMVLPIRLQENLSFKLVFSPQAALVINQLASDGGANLTFVDAHSELNGLRW